MENISPLHNLYKAPLTKHSAIPFIRTRRRTSAETSYSSSLSHFSPPSFPPPRRISSKFRFYRALNELQSLDTVKAIHSQIIKTSNSAASANILIDFYLSFGDCKSSITVLFTGFPQHIPSPDSFLRKFKSLGFNALQILSVFGELLSKGVTFHRKVFSFVLGICAAFPWLGVQTHAVLIKTGFDVSLKSSLIQFYSNSWGIDIGHRVFDQLPHRVNLTGNETIASNFQNEDPSRRDFGLFQEMQSCGKMKPDDLMIVKLLQSCGKMKCLNVGRQIHGYVLRFALESNVYICNSLITMYSKNNKLKLSRMLFDSLKNRSIASWNSIISAYASLGYLNNAWNLLGEMKRSGMKQDIVNWNCLISGHVLHGRFEEALFILCKMQNEGFRPNSTTIISFLQALSDAGFLRFGKETHCYALRNGFHCYLYVETSLVDMYVKNDHLKYAQSVFDVMKCRNIFAWNSLISGYSFKARFKEALKLLKVMERGGMKADLVTWNALLNGYSMWGHLKGSYAMIRRIKSVGMTPNVVSWTALMAGCSKYGNFKASFNAYFKMQRQGVEPNSATMSSLLQSCAGQSLLQKGEEIHCFCIRKGFVDENFVSTSLIDMYTRSGSLDSACKVFKMIRDRTLASWNCMIMGFSIYGLGRKAISLFDDMRGLAVQPDAITFTALLSGIKKSGLLNEGWELFDSITTVYNMVPTIEHYSCMVELLGRSGFTDEALSFVEEMQQVKPDATIWGALLKYATLHKNVKVKETAAWKVSKLQPHNSKVKKMCDFWSWIQINHTIHVFSAKGRSHRDEGEIYFELYHLVSKTKKMGYVPDVGSVHDGVAEIDKEKMVLSHTEKLAITYGLIKVKNNGIIRVVTNCKVCMDCHELAKYTTLVERREILLKDAARFHHFREGKCSCKDLW